MAHTHTHTHTHTWAHTHTHTLTHTYKHTHAHKFTHIRVYILHKDKWQRQPYKDSQNIHKHIHPHTHTHTHTDIHIYRERVSACRAKQGKHIAFRKNYKSASEVSRTFIYMYIYTPMGRGYPPA